MPELLITAPARMVNISQGMVVPNDLHTWPADGNESLPFYSEIPCYYPVPAANHLDGYAFCYMLDIFAMVAVQTFLLLRLLSFSESPLQPH